MVEPASVAVSTHGQPPPDARIAMAWAHTARFVITAAKMEQVPASLLHETAFVGRSNAGKSTAINTLANHKRLAFASRTPGRTQHINLFAVGPKDEPSAQWADLPGYGYAAVERSAKHRWQEVMAEYLVSRPNLGSVVLLCDSRLGLTELDHRLLQWIAPRVGSGEVKLLVLLTKADKLNRAEGQRALLKANEELGEIASEQSDIGVSLFSALKRQGVEDAALALHGWAHGLG